MVDEQPDDDALLAALRRIPRHADPVPGPVLEAARGSFTWRTIDAELAELAYDSAPIARERRSCARPAPAGC